MPAKVFKLTEDNFLRRYYRTKSNSELAKLMNCSAMTIQIRLSELKLQRTEEENRRLMLRNKTVKKGLKKGDIFFKNGSYRIKINNAGSVEYHEYLYRKHKGVVPSDFKVVLKDLKYHELKSYNINNLKLKAISVLDKYAKSDY